MKVTMVIPSYWSGEKKGDVIYDHPTPLDSEGTLLRAIESIDVLSDKDFKLVILAVADAAAIEQQVENKVASIIESASAEVLLFGPSKLKQIHELLVSTGKKEYNDLLKLSGYSNVRNMCIFIPHILGSEVAVLIDDDEVFEDPEYMQKAKEFIGKNIEGQKVNAVAGYYLQPDGDYHVKKTVRPWMKYWDQYDRMNEAFGKLIGSGPRLKETPFVFGGNMVIHRDLFTVVPFDPKVTRGEDIDFLINAKMFGFHFFLDNQLSIKHRPPSKAYPTWTQLREDIHRFIYERAKIEHQKAIAGMTRVYPEDFDPYPGCFLKPDLEAKIENSSKLLSDEYLALGDKGGSEEALNNVIIAKTEAVPKYDPFLWLCELQKRWHELMRFSSQEEIRSQMQDIVLV